MLLGPLSFMNLVTLCRTMSKGGCQTAKSRFSNRMIWITEATFLIGGAEVGQCGAKAPHQNTEGIPCCHLLAPPRSDHSSKQLCLHMRDLKLQARIQKSRSQVQQGRAPTLAEGSPKKQVQFDLNKELGSKPTLPKGVTVFLLGA